MRCTHCDSSRTRKHGFDRLGQRRFRCLACRRSFTEFNPRLLGSMRIPEDKALLALNCLVEGVGVRPTVRLTGLNKATVLRLIVEAGERCQRFLDARVRDVRANFVEMDEIWSFVHTKRGHLRPGDPKTWGDAYCFLSLCAESKLIINHQFGRRDAETVFAFVDDLAGRVRGRLQLSTDALAAFFEAVHTCFADRVDYTQIMKVYGQDLDASAREGYVPSRLRAIIKRVMLGRPDENLASTSHSERLNLSVRTSLRRYVRLGLGFSKKLRNLRAAMAVWIAHYNFCRIHSTVRCTPAMESGLTGKVWNLEDVLRGDA